MKHRALLLIFLMALGVGHGTNAYEASFDCARASTATERAICGSAELARADAELGRVYREALRHNAALRSDQIQWVRSRNDACAAEAACLLAHIRDRISHLRSHPTATRETAERRADAPTPGSAAQPVRDTSTPRVQPHDADLEFVPKKVVVECSADDDSEEFCTYEDGSTRTTYRDNASAFRVECALIVCERSADASSERCTCSDDGKKTPIERRKD